MIFVNDPVFSLDYITFLSNAKIAEKLRKLACKTRIHTIFNKLFKKIKPVYLAKFLVILSC